MSQYYYWENTIILMLWSKDRPFCRPFMIKDAGPDGLPCLGILGIIASKHMKYIKSGKALDLIQIGCYILDVSGDLRGFKNVSTLNHARRNNILIAIVHGAFLVILQLGSIVSTLLKCLMYAFIILKNSKYEQESLCSKVLWLISNLVQVRSLTNITSLIAYNLVFVRIPCQYSVSEQYRLIFIGIPYYSLTQNHSVPSHQYSCCSE